MNLDTVINKIAALGIPGLVLVVAMATSGFSGAAAITVALAALGGPLGMLGGIAALGVLGLLAHTISEYGIEKVYQRVLDDLKKKGHTEEKIIDIIDGYRLSRKLKSPLKEFIRKRMKPDQTKRIPPPRQSDQTRLNALVIQAAHQRRYICRACVGTIGSHERVVAENPEVPEPRQDHYECSACHVFLAWV